MPGMQATEEKSGRKTKRHKGGKGRGGFGGGKGGGGAPPPGGGGVSEQSETEAAKDSVIALGATNGEPGVYGGSE